MNEQHSVSSRSYFVVFLALLVLLIATYLVAEIDLGPLNLIVALGIAVLKAVLVMLFFMHVRYSSRRTWLFAGAGFLWLGILIALSLSDFLTRTLIMPG